jgi:electron transfer flavoprotein alpha subunit
MVLGLVEHDRGVLNELSHEALTFARRLGGEVEAVIVGEEARGLADGLGVSRVHLAVDPRLDDYAPAGWAAALTAIVESRSTEVVLAAGSDRGQEVMAHVGARLDAPVAANVVSVAGGDPFVVTRQRWGGSLLEEARVHGPVKLLTVAAHVLAAEPAPAGAAAVEEFAPALSDADLVVKVVRRDEPQAGKIQLGDARVVVGGGRGVGSAEGFAVLEELAGVLGGAVGGSRVVTNLGWRPHADQIGQTGARIAPELYIACGVSGAIQHMVGCKGAKRILAINKDPNAPIVARADYAVIGDLGEIVPAIVAALRGG